MRLALIISTAHLLSLSHQSLSLLPRSRYISACFRGQDPSPSSLPLPPSLSFRGHCRPASRRSGVGHCVAARARRRAGAGHQAPAQAGARRARLRLRLWRAQRPAPARGTRAGQLLQGPGGGTRRAGGGQARPRRRRGTQRTAAAACFFFIFFFCDFDVESICDVNQINLICCELISLLWIRSCTFLLVCTRS